MDTKTGEPEVIGFIGAYAYDIILYLAKALQGFMLHTLAVDHNPAQTLTRMAANTSSNEELSENKKSDASNCKAVLAGSEILCFSGVDIVQGCLTKERNNLFDCVLIDFGLNNMHKDLIFCTRVFYIGDMYMHTVRSVHEAAVMNERVITGIIIRDYISCKLTPAFLIDRMGKKTKDTRILMLPFDQEDHRQRCLMEADESIPYYPASDGMKEVICTLVCDVLPNVQPKEYKKRMLMKRRYQK